MLTSPWKKPKRLLRNVSLRLPISLLCPLGTQIGLKPVVLLVIGLAIYGQIPSKKKKKEEEGKES